ncbi:MAG TPA: DoxX family protein [Bryobacteraceae bacterium]|nr:DoxX family protein [Bryobacteraceae bacterium]
MSNSVAEAEIRPSSVELPSWKTLLGVASAVILGLLFISSGVWKLIEPFEWAARVVQAKVPGPLGLPAALAVGITETLGGVLLLVPRFRRWGAWITGFLLVVFMAYFAYFYKELTGADCSCFPWLKRTVGPGFFIGDGAMLLLALMAGLWSRRPEGLRGPAVIFAAIVVFGFASLGITYARQTGAPAPESIVVENQSYSLQAGRHFLYFFDPECSHCFQAAKAMASYRWKEGVTVIGIPTVNPQFAPGFLKETGLTARLSSDHDKLKAAFPFGNAPFAVAVENGRQRESFIAFEGDQPARGLREIGFVE